ncbi:tRNA pseudouridine(55) synthase TruB [Candidatus Dojkabacteria bacterium]|nr:tRNA pseudouridine(55) synthase TruB [Candidatus Dojkabacteria bacterium]
MDTIKLIDKPAGISSYDVIRQLKKELPRGQKIGHAGTLDPFATGLLIILLGKSTKRFQEFQNMKKHYVVELEFGYETDTLDRTGKITQKISGKDEKLMKSLDRETVERELGKFEGEILQMPPRYSAKKINGKRAYKLARQGKDFKLKPKEVTVYSAKLLSYDPADKNGIERAKIEIVCASGCYIRSIVRDLGRNLEVYATSVELRRTRIGNYSVDDAEKISSQASQKNK